MILKFRGFRIFFVDGRLEWNSLLKVSFIELWVSVVFFFDRCFVFLGWFCVFIGYGVFYVYYFM